MKTVAQVRADIPVLSKYAFLNAGTLFPTPQPVMQAFFDAYRRWHELGAGLPQHYVAWRETVIDEVRQRLADFLGCSPLELAFTQNATEGVNIIAFGIDWEPGDEVVITDAEHEANAVVWLYNEQRFGIKLRIVPTAVTPDQFLQNLRQALNERTRLVSIAHVLSHTGQVLPVEEVVNLAHQNGSLVLLDGAHAVGQLPVDLRALDCDFYTTNGHKWLFGPAGTGVLYVRSDRIELVRPSFMGDVAQKQWDYPRGRTFVPPQGARRYEYATRNWPAIVGLGAGLDYVNQIGLDNIRARVLQLTEQLKADLLTVPGCRLHSPREARWSSGLVAFEIAGQNAKELIAYLEQRGICPRWLNDRVIRVTVAYFTLEQELADMVAALKEYLQQAPAKDC
ncbi:MAG: aminotransferase class V-fold PLP-dependent enzyme [Bacillota bacterium]|jgi:selenocysteine lyase/cysteine desulfurase